MTARSRQLSFLKKEPSAYGGVLRNTRKGRQGERPLAVRKTIHLVLRSSKARGEMSFRRKENSVRIQQIVTKHAVKNGVKILMMANVGNHLHLHIKLGNRFGYAPFIRAITGAIALVVMKNFNAKNFEKTLAREKAPSVQAGAIVPTRMAPPESEFGDDGDSQQSHSHSHSHSQDQGQNQRQGQNQNQKQIKEQKQFWDYRPFTRVIEGRRHFLRLQDYIRINQLEGIGIQRKTADLIVKKFAFDLAVINAVP